jgi:hypothetical protein
LVTVPTVLDAADGATLDPVTAVAFARATDAAEALAALLLALAPGARVPLGVGVQIGIGVGLGPGVADSSDAPSGPLMGGRVAVGGRGVGEGEAVTLAMLFGFGEGVGVIQVAGASGAAIACPADHPKSANSMHTTIALTTPTAHGRRQTLCTRIPSLTVGAICPGTECAGSAQFVKLGQPRR